MSTRLDPLIPARASLPPPAASAPVVRHRAKPAKRSKAMALGLSVLTTAGLAAQFAHDRQAAAGGAAVPPNNAMTSPTTTATATVADGTYVGQASTNRWGTVQVQAVYSGGKLTNVEILSSPDGERKSVAINQRALPRLIASSISAQSAAVNSVSGATYTSASYKQSLQSAIDKATAARA